MAWTKPLLMGFVAAVKSPGSKKKACRIEVSWWKPAVSYFVSPSDGSQKNSRISWTARRARKGNSDATKTVTYVVTTLDSALQRLNLGIVVWVEVSRNHDEKFPATFECEQLGYAKTNGNWGLAIRKLLGNVNSPENSKVRDIWLFNDAPRGVRLRAVEKLPEVIDQLARSAMRTAERLKKKVAETRGFATSIGVSQPDDVKEKR